MLSNTGVKAAIMVKGEGQWQAYKRGVYGEQNYSKTFKFTAFKSIFIYFHVHFSAYEEHGRSRRTQFSKSRRPFRRRQFKCIKASDPTRLSVLSTSSPILLHTTVTGNKRFAI